MITVSAQKRLALLVDGDNFPPDLAGSLFVEVEKLGAVAIRRVYGGSTAITGWRAMSAKYGIRLHEVLPGKNATDMRLAIDAMDALHGDKVEGFCIVSSDNDFAELATRLREDGVSVHGFGGSNAAAGFKRACDTFLVLEKPIASSTPPTIHAVAPRAATPAKVAKETGKLTSASTPKVTDITRKKIEQALRSLSKGRSHVPLTELGNHLPKGKKGQGKLKTRLKALDFKLVPSKDGLTVEVSQAGLSRPG